MTESHACGEEFPEPRWTSTRPERQGSLWVRRDSHSTVMGLAGEADFTNHDQLLAALEEAVAGHGDVYLDVSGLTFVDVAATRAFISAAASLPPTRRMVLIEPCHALRIIVSSAGFAIPDQLVLVGSQGRSRTRAVKNPTP
ncbi:MAG: STAS domain-containing protein [Nocardioidaceae bacterium]